MRYKNKFHRVADPLRHLLDSIQSLPNPIGSPFDKINVGVFRTRTLFSSFQQLLAKDEATTLERLRVSLKSSKCLQYQFLFLELAALYALKWLLRSCKPQLETKYWSKDWHEALPVQEEGFSEAIIDRFFKPFLGGIFFNRDLSVTSRLFEFVMRCLATGSNCLPSQGIGAVANQLASGLPSNSVHLGEGLQLA